MFLRPVILLLAALLLAMPVAALDASHILVVANSKAEGSTKVAEHYAAARSIPKSRVLQIEASDKEEITRKEYDDTIRTPLLAAVTKDESIFCIVLCRGVPLKVRATDGAKPITQRDWASVDGELTMLLKGEYALEGWIENPLFDTDTELNRATGFLMVTRLDGPTVEDAIGLVDRAVLAEVMGPEGRSFLDTRGMTKPDGYGERDIHMRTVADSWKSMGLEFDHDDKGPVVDLSARPAGLHYYGWYEGNPAKWTGAPQFRTGAIGVHLHSFSASTVRNVKQNWVAPMLSWGVTATYGTVYEPFTVGFPYEGVFWKKLASGHTFGEAGMYSNRLFSWQATFVGDPLYRPYPKDAAIARKAARERIAARLESTKPAEGDLTPAESAALSMLQDWIASVEEATKRGESDGVSAFAGLRFRTHGWGLEEVIGKRLPGVDKAAAKLWKSIKASLKKSPKDTGEYERAVAEWTGLEVHAELLAYREELEKEQEKHAAKLLKSAIKDLEKDTGVLKAWQQARQAGEHKFCESGVAGKNLAAKIEADKQKLLKDQADAALQPHVAKYTKKGAKSLTDKEKSSIADLISSHPECDNRRLLEKLLEDAK